MALPLPTDYLPPQKDPDYSGLSTWGAFWLACASADQTKVKSILHQDAQKDQELLQHGFQASIQYRATSIIRLLLDHGAQITPAIEGVALHSASQEIYQIFLDHGWYIGKTDILSSSTVLSNRPLLQWLLAHGADPDVGEDPHPRIPRVYSAAASCVDPSTFQLLLSYNKDRSLIIASQPLHEAAAGRNTQLLAWLIDQSKLRLDVNGLDTVHPGYVKGTPLHYAVEDVTDSEKCIETVQALLDRGADVTKKNQLGQMPIDRVQENYGGEIPESLNSIVKLLTPKGQKQSGEENKCSML